MKKNLDDVLKEFQKKAEKAKSSNRPFWEGTKEDDIYDVDIHIWRKPGMGNSLQTISGNKISIMVATASYLQTLISHNVITMEDFDNMINAIKEVINLEK